MSKTARLRKLSVREAVEWTPESERRAATHEEAHRVWAQREREIREERKLLRCVRGDAREWSLIDATQATCNPRDAVVYFIQADDGPIKVGLSYFQGAEGRVAGLQGSNAHELRLCRVVRGSSAVERAIHGYFAADRIRGEWFAPSDDLRFVAGIV